MEHAAKKQSSEHVVDDYVQELEAEKLRTRKYYDKAEKSQEEVRQLKKELAQKQKMPEKPFRPSKKIVLDDELKNYLPALSQEAYTSLEAELIADGGCRDALVMWGCLLVDGYNRYEICQKHNLSYDIVEKEFKSKDEVKLWMLINQDARRNYTDEQRMYYRGKRYDLEKSLWGGDRKSEKSSGQNDHMKNSGIQEDKNGEKTEDRLAREYNVAPKTIRRDSKVAQAIDQIGEVSPVAKQQILAGEVNINKKELERLATRPEEIKEVATEIRDGVYEQNKKKAVSKPKTKNKILEMPKIISGEEVQGDKELRETEQGDSKPRERPEIDKANWSSPVDSYVHPVTPNAPQQRQVDFIIAGIHTLNGVIKNIVRDFNTKLPDVTDSEERNEVKTIFEEYINKLQLLCNQI